MRCLRMYAIVFCIVVLCDSGLIAQQPDSAEYSANPLFVSQETLSLTLEAPLDEVFRERGQESSYHDGVLTMEGSDSVPLVLNIRVKTRGKFRLQRSTCSFPPLRIDFRRQQVGGTLFEGQNRLKLVTHCRNGRSEYEQYVLKEYLAYRVLNVLTDLSFRVRLARITYIDTEEEQDTVTAYGFLIEDEDDVAARNGGEVLSAPQVPPLSYDQPQLALVEVFQYLVGNPDWDAFSKPPDAEDCCHNIKVIGSQGGPVYPIPYDFDFTGMVDARYATPDRSLNIETVRQRVFRGICRPQEDLNEALQVVAARQGEVYSLFNNQDDLELDELERSIEYLDEFFEILYDEGRVRGRMVRPCRRF